MNKITVVAALFCIVTDTSDAQSTVRPSYLATEVEYSSTQILQHIEGAIRIMNIRMAESIPINSVIHKAKSGNVLVAIEMGSNISSESMNTVVTALRLEDSEGESIMTPELDINLARQIMTIKTPATYLVDRAWFGTAASAASYPRTWIAIFSIDDAFESPTFLKVPGLSTRIRLPIKAAVANISGLSFKRIYACVAGPKTTYLRFRKDGKVHLLNLLNPVSYDKAIELLDGLAADTARYSIADGILKFTNWNGRGNVDYEGTVDSNVISLKYYSRLEKIDQKVSCEILRK